MASFLRIVAVALLVILGVPAGVALFMVFPFLIHEKVTIAIERPQPQPLGSEPSLVAGVAVRDITPPPGIPKFGYSSIGQDGDGFRTRLRARAFYLRSPGQRPVVVVQTDLGAGSLILRHRVAERVAARTDIGAGDLSITSTHTHSGPGLYLESNFYNAHGARRGGFDPRLFDFLVDQISEAVLEAYTERRSARIATGQRRVWGATRNRSLAAWLRNPNAVGLTESTALEVAAVNPTMTMVRIDQRDDAGVFHPAGAFTLYSIHGTGIPADADPYHADIWAYFAGELEWSIRRHYAPPWPVVHGAFQATHGDTTPFWYTNLRGETESDRIGTYLAHEAWALFQELDGRLRDDVVIRSAMREVPLSSLVGADRNELCERAILGAATVGAALGDETPGSYLWPFAKGYPRRLFLGTCHGAKHWLGSVFQLFVAADLFPTRALFHAMQFGDLLVVATPWEITLESGNTIRRAVAEAVPDGAVSMIEISSLANGYLAYSTTPEEYALQYYEGGHTIYGPGTTAFLARQSANLAGALFADGSFADLPERWQFELSADAIFPPPGAPRGQRETLRKPQLELGRATTGPYWSYRYRDVGRGDIRLDAPLVHVEARHGDGLWEPLVLEGRPIDDSQYDVEIRHKRDLGDDMAEYELRWYKPSLNPDRQHRFVVAARADLPAFASPAF